MLHVMPVYLTRLHAHLIFLIFPLLENAGSTQVEEV